MPAPSACPADAELSDFITGISSDEAAAAVERHLAVCEHCLERTRRIVPTDTLASALRAGNDDTAEHAALPAVQVLIDKLRQRDGHDTLSTRLDNTSLGTPTPSLEVSELLSNVGPPQRIDEIGRLGDFRLLSLLGAGGMGAVFLAEDMQLKRRIALKLLKPELLRRPEAAERFLREAQAAASVHHDHVVTIFQVGRTDGVPFIAQELLQGENLEDRLQREQRLSAGEAARIGSEVAEGLAAAHAQGLLHRDIKPSNIWLTTRGRVKLLDFGLALLQNDNMQLTSTGAILGTPAYMSPEQAAAAELDARSDLFSLGCVLYRMTTGQSPFQRKDAISTLRALAIDTPPPALSLNPEVPAALSALISQLLEKTPEKRPASASLVVEALARIEPAPSAAKPKPPLSAGEAAQRQRRVVLVAVAAIALVALGVAVMMVHERFVHTLPAKDGSVEATSNTVEHDKPEPEVSWHGWPADAPPPAIAPFNADQAKQHQEAWAKYLNVPVEWTGPYGMKFRLIPPGEFTMGTEPTEMERLAAIFEKQDPSMAYRILFLKTETPRHITLTEPFYLGMSEVTCQQFAAYIDDSGSKTDAENDGLGFLSGANGEFSGQKGESWRTVKDLENPCGYLSWNDCDRFRQFLARRFHGDYRLPTEAEWEFACRAGTTTSYYVGERLTPTQAAIKGSTVRLGMVHRPNAFGLYDMHGSASEWCSDFFEPTPEERENTIDPYAALGRTRYRVYRGGTRGLDQWAARSAGRDAALANSRTPDSGVRVAVSVKTVQAALEEKEEREKEDHAGVTKPTIEC